MRTLVFVLFSLGTGHAQTIAPLTPQDSAKVSSGEVVIRRLPPTGGDGVAARAFAVVKAPAKKVWPVLRDCQHFKEFLPRTKESVLKSRVGLTSVCYTKIDMPFPFSDLWADVKSVEEVVPGGAFKRSWSLIKGTYKRNNGSWIVKPWGPSGSESLLIYAIDLDPDTSVPDFIIRKAQTSTLPDLFEAIRRRVRSLP